MRTRCTFSLAVALVFSCLNLPAPARAQFDEMLLHLPDSTNALVMVNIEKLLNSPIARQEGWRDDARKRFTAGLISIPAGASQLVIAAEMDFRTMKPIWEMALLRMDSAPPLAEIARRYSGTADTVAGAPALRLPDDSYIVRFSDRCLGGFTPGNRQMVSQWVRGGKNRSPYFQEAAGYATAGTEMIMALDMTDVAAIGDVQEGTKTLDSGLLKQAKVDPAELARVLQGVKGLTLGVKFEKRIFAKIKLDLQDDASLLSGIAKPFFLAMVAQRGMMLNEFEDWKAEVEGNRIIFGGYLSSSGLTRLSSLVDLPTPALCATPKVRPIEDALRAAATRAAETTKPPESGGSQGTPAPDAASTTVPQGRIGFQPVSGNAGKVAETPPPQVAPSPESGPAQGTPPAGPSAAPAPAAPDINPGQLSAIVEATQQYFHSTGHLIGDLRGRQHSARTMGQCGLWYQNYARRIDRLPLLDVDDQMLGYGSYVANQMRKASFAIKGAFIRAHAEEVAVGNQPLAIPTGRTTVARGSYHGSGQEQGEWNYESRGPTFYRPMTYQERWHAQHQVRAMENANAVGAVEQIELEIDSATAEIRAGMTKKYRSEF